MAKNVGRASFDAPAAYSVPRASGRAEALSAPVKAGSRRSIPDGGGTPVARRHVDPYKADVAVMQRRMRDAGIDPGPIDGLKGPLTRGAMEKYQTQFGKSAAAGLDVDPSYAERGRQARESYDRKKGRESELGLDSAGQPQPGAAPQGNLDAGATADGLRLPATSGKATTFWNGNFTYKGQRDTANMSKGAWGDANKPTDYFAALPVGLSGGGKAWHNKKLLITNPRTGRQVVVPVQDKGPHPSTGAQIDLSPVAKEALGAGFMDNINVKIAFARDDAPIGPVR